MQKSITVKQRIWYFFVAVVFFILGTACGTGLFDRQLENLRAVRTIQATLVREPDISFPTNSKGNVSEVSIWFYTDKKDCDSIQLSTVLSGDLSVQQRLKIQGMNIGDRVEFTLFKKSAQAGIFSAQTSFPVARGLKSQGINLDTKNTGRLHWTDGLYAFFGLILFFGAFFLVSFGLRK